MNSSYLKFRLTLGTVSFIIGLLATNLTLFRWSNPDGFSYLLGEYARYACALGGFSAIFFGAMLIKDFFVLRALIISQQNTGQNSNAWLMRIKTEWQQAEHSRKHISMDPELDFFLETEEELQIVV